MEDLARDQWVGDRVMVQCPICGSASDSTFMFLTGFRIARCSGCGFIFVNPRPSEDSLLTLYSNQRTNVSFKPDYEPLEYEYPVLSQVIRKVQDYVPAGDLLEVGCGRGDFLRIAQTRGFSVAGCDIFGEQKPAYKGIVFYDGPLKRAKLPEGCFDVVVIRNILEHFFDPNVELKEIRRILKPNGYLYLKVPNVVFEHGFRCKLVFGRKHNLEPPYHLNYFSPASLQAFLKNGQFQFVSWLLEQPTFYSKWTLNLKRQAGFRLIKALYFLSGGRMFPKITLSCIAQKNDRCSRSFGRHGEADCYL